ncbi:MAG: AI-2E family transporter [Candidatus Saccharimonadales bacterium]
MRKHQDQQLFINIESKTVIRILALVVATLLLLSFVHNIAKPLTLIFTSFFLALALNPAVSKISIMLHTKSRIRATALAYILVLTFLISFIAFVIPPLVKQTVDFIQQVPSSIQDYKNDSSPINDFVTRYNLGDQVDRFSQDFGSRFGDIGKPVLSTAGAIGTTVASTIIVLVLTFMMLVEGPRWIKSYWSVQSAAKRVHRQEIAARMYKVVTNYVNGQVLIAAIGGTFASIFIFIFSQIFNAPVNAIALGGIIALFALLPLIGTILGATIVVLACLLVSVPLAIAVAVYFIIYQQIENVTLQPYIQSRGNSLTPLLVFVAALLGIGLGGILGAFVAIPAAGCIKILAEDYFLNHRPTKQPITEA